MIGVLVVTLGLVVVERLVVTEREEVAQALDAVAVALTTNDLPRVLTFVSQSAPQTRAAAQSNLAQSSDSHRGGWQRFEDRSASRRQPPTATARFVARFSGSDKSGQTPIRQVRAAAGSQPGQGRRPVADRRVQAAAVCRATEQPRTLNCVCADSNPKTGRRPGTTSPTVDLLESLPADLDAATDVG